jgi:hypothetical protein
MGQHFEDIICPRKSSRVWRRSFAQGGLEPIYPVRRFEIHPIDLLVLRAVLTSQKKMLGRPPAAAGLPTFGRQSARFRFVGGVECNGLLLNPRDSMPLCSDILGRTKVLVWHVLQV